MFQFYSKMHPTVTFRYLEQDLDHHINLQYYNSKFEAYKFDPNGH